MSQNDLAKAIQQKVAGETAAKIIDSLTDEELKALLRPAIAQKLHDITDSYDTTKLLKEKITEKAKIYMNDPEIQAFIEQKAQLLVTSTVKALFSELASYQSRAWRWGNVESELKKILEEMKPKK